MVKLNAPLQVLTALLVILVIFNTALLPVFATETEEGPSASENAMETANPEGGDRDTINAGDHEATPAIQFMVLPVYPDNQKDTNLGYFDLTVKPGTTQNLQIMVSNHSNEKKVFSVGGVSASTTPSGIVDYTTPNVRDETLKHPFSGMIKVEQEQFTLDASAERVINIPLTLPSTSFDGIILGGLRVTDITERLKREEQKETVEGHSLSLDNEYEFIIAVVLRETEKEITPNFELGNVYFESDNGREAIIAEVRNTEPMIIKGYRYSASIRSEGSDADLFSIKDAEVSFAPNSVMPSAFSDRTGRGIEPGTYHYIGSITDGDKVWELSETVTIEKEAAQEISEPSENQQERADSKTNTLLIIVMGTLAVLGALLIFLLVKIKRD